MTEFLWDWTWSVYKQYKGKYSIGSVTWDCSVSYRKLCWICQAIHVTILDFCHIYIALNLPLRYTPVGYMVLRVQVKFAHSLLKCVGCEWGTTSVYFAITYVCFIPSRLPVFAVEPQYLLKDFFIFVQSIIWRTHTKSLKNHVGLKFEWGL